MTISGPICIVRGARTSRTNTVRRCRAAGARSAAGVDGEQNDAEVVAEVREGRWPETAGALAEPAEVEAQWHVGGEGRDGEVGEREREEGGDVDLGAVRRARERAHDEAAEGELLGERRRDGHQQQDPREALVLEAGELARGGEAEGG